MYRHTNRRKCFFVRSLVVFTSVFLIVSLACGQDQDNNIGDYKPADYDYLFNSAKSIYYENVPSPMDVSECKRPIIKTRSLPRKIHSRYNIEDNTVILDVEKISIAEQDVAGATEYYITHEYVHSVMTCAGINVQKQHCYMAFQGMFNTTAREVARYRVQKDSLFNPDPLLWSVEGVSKHYIGSCNAGLLGTKYIN